MIKVFLVEDEVVMRNGIKKNIPWEKEGFEFVGEASDGELAYPMIKNKKPDILITDIRMPFMDGLELSRLVKQEMPQTKIIILSGYSEFDYAKTAINIGVTEYLLKPISSAKLLESVKRVGDMIEQEREQIRMMDLYQKEMQENVQLQKHNLWISLVSNQLSVAEMFESGYKLGIDFTASNYQVVLFKLIQNEKAQESFENMVTLSEEIEDLAEKWEQILCFDRSPEGWAFLIKGDSEEAVKDGFHCLKEELHVLLKKYEKVNYFGGVGIVVQRLRDISISYRSAAKAFASRFFLETDQIIESQENLVLQQTEQEKIDVTKIRSKKDEQELLDRFLKSGTLEDVESFVENYFNSVGERNFQSLMYRQYIIMNLFFSVTDFLRLLDIPMEQISPEYQDINAMVLKVASGDSLTALVTGLFTEVLELRDKKAQKKYTGLLEEARVFIQENYQSESMSLNMVAEKIGISPSYFSTIFSAEMGKTFVEYLTEVRLEKAKELLMCTTLRSAEIGYQVGYKDSHYFSYIFKKIVGCTPKEFRNRGKE